MKKNICKCGAMEWGTYIINGINSIKVTLDVVF